MSGGGTKAIRVSVANTSNRLKRGQPFVAGGERRHPNFQLRGKVMKMSQFGALAAT
jgi:hypothetical protein